MEPLQLWSECIARAAVGTREDQQDTPPAEVLQTEIAAPVQSRQAEIGRVCAGVQAIAFDFAACEGAAAEASISAFGVGLVTAAEFQFVQPSLHFIQPQQDAAILTQQ